MSHLASGPRPPWEGLSAYRHTPSDRPADGQIATGTAVRTKLAKPREPTGPMWVMTLNCLCGRSWQFGLNP